MPSDHLPQSYTPLQSITGRACRTRQPPSPTALMGFGPLRRLRQSGAHCPRACLTRFVALSGFLSLLALYFSRRLPALFHAGNALGVPPSRAFPPRQAGTPSQGPLPSCRWPSRAARLQGLGARRGSVAATRHISGLAATRCSPGLSSPPGSSPLPRWDPYGSLLSWPCPQPTLSSACGWPPESCSTGKLAQLSRVCRPSWGLPPRRPSDPPGSPSTRNSTHPCIPK
jgi:hypothetical protein